MGFQDVAFLPSRTSFSATFIKKFGRGESLWTTTCLESVFGVIKGMLPVKHFCTAKPLFVSVKFDRDRKR